jgi:predicted Zn finger-like uncharacterized protein
MQTQCPHCQTRFRLTEAQLDVADGYVRCGVCDQVFNALDEPEYASGETVNFNATSATDPVRKDAFDFFDESINESLPHVVPEQLREDNQPETRTIHTLLWSIGILCLTFTLMLEYVWFNREKFIEVDFVNKLFTQLCSHTDCSTVSIRQPQAIELTSRNVYSHPEHKDALLVNVSIKNKADYAQPYPMMQIDFSDVRGFVVAARRFLPGEYLAQSGQALPLLAPGSQADISIAIKDPGKQAVTYEFSFL